MKIGLTQRVEVVASYGERRDCLDQSWSRLLSSLGYTPIPLPNLSSGISEYLDAIKLDGAILTGGNDLASEDSAQNSAPERDHFESKLIEYFSRKKLPLLGICRGMQLLAVREGAQLELIKSHVRTPHKILPKQKNRLCVLKTREVNSFHRFGLSPESIKSPWDVIATASDGSAEAIAHQKLPQLGIMWHPERGDLHPEDTQIIDQLFKVSA